MGVFHKMTFFLLFMSSFQCHFLFYVLINNTKTYIVIKYLLLSICTLILTVFKLYVFLTKQRHFEAFDVFSDVKLNFPNFHLKIYFKNIFFYSLLLSKVWWSNLLLYQILKFSFFPNT